MVTDLIVANGKIVGVKTGREIEIKGKSVILTNGTFLNEPYTLVKNNLVVVEQERELQLG